MVDSHTDFIQIEDNFAKDKNIVSIPIIQSKLSFEPKITIAIPTYKRADLLKEALDSAINQIDYYEYEIIVVDNNPERGCGTEQLMSKYQDSRISYYKNYQNLGMVGNWNRCIELSKGMSITILHDDDALNPSFIIKSIKNIQNKLSFFSFGVEANQDILPNFYLVKNVNCNLKRFSTTRFLFGNLSPFPGIVFNKEAAKLIGGFNENKTVADYDFWIRLSQHTKCYFSTEKLAFYRISNFQLTSEIYVDVVIHTYRRRKQIKYYKLYSLFSNYELYKMYLNYKPTEEDRLKLKKNQMELDLKFTFYDHIYRYKFLKKNFDLMLGLLIKYV